MVLIPVAVATDKPAVEAVAAAVEAPIAVTAVVDSELLVAAIATEVDPVAVLAPTLENDELFPAIDDPETAAIPADDAMERDCAAPTAATVLAPAVVIAA